MVLKSDTRPFLESEIERMNKQVYSLEGMFSGNIVHQDTVRIDPIQSKWEEKYEKGE